MTAPPSILSRLWSAWLGLLIFALVGFGGYFLLWTVRPLLLAGLIFALFSGLAAFFAYRFGRQGLAAGLVLGYLLLSVVSSGTCSFLRESGDLAELSGAVLYAMVLIGSVILLIIATLVNAVRNRRRNQS